MLLTSSGSKGWEKVAPSIPVELIMSRSDLNSDGSEVETDRSELTELVNTDEVRTDDSPDGVSISAKFLNEGSPRTMKSNKMWKMQSLINKKMLFESAIG